MKFDEYAAQYYADQGVKERFCYTLYKLDLLDLINPLHVLTSTVAGDAINGGWEV